jgi:hypothetical protein
MNEQIQSILSDNLKNKQLNDVNAEISDLLEAINND